MNREELVVVTVLFRRSNYNRNDILGAVMEWADPLYPVSSAQKHQFEEKVEKVKS